MIAHPKKISFWNTCFIVLMIVFVSITITVSAIMSMREIQFMQQSTNDLGTVESDTSQAPTTLPLTRDFHSDTLTRCDLTKHDYTSGEWVFHDHDNMTSSVTGLALYYEVKDEVAGNLVRKHPNVVQPYSSYDWRPHNCKLLKFDAEQFCSKMKSKNLLIVGDSISFMNAQSLFMQLNPESEFILRQLNQNSIPICEDVDLTFVRNDHLQNKICDDDICVPFFHLIEQNSVMILNSGAHYRNITSIIEHLDELYEFLEAIEWKGYVIYRVTAPGHPNCKMGEPPISSLKAAEERLEKDGMYNWDKFDGQNEIIAEYIRRKRNSFVLDIYGMTMLRPDGHRAPSDCLHYYLPSVVDTWTLLEFNLLQHILTNSFT